MTLARKAQDEAWVNEQRLHLHSVCKTISCGRHRQERAKSPKTAQAARKELHNPVSPLHVTRA